MAGRNTPATDEVLGESLGEYIRDPEEVDARNVAMRLAYNADRRRNTPLPVSAQEYEERKGSRGILFQQEAGIEEKREAAWEAFLHSAVPMMETEFTREEYNRLFPMGEVDTPTGKVRMGGHQFERLKDKGRENYLGAMYQTLHEPSVVIDSTDAQGRTAQLFIKSFTGKDGQEGKRAAFSVVVNREGVPVAVSFGPRTQKQAERKIKTASIFHYTAEGGGQTVATGNGVPANTGSINPLPPDVNPLLFQNTEEDEVRMKYAGTDGWMKAPNGKDTKLTEKQWLQVRTPSFKAWFGDWEGDPENASKAVDENGEPLVVYHGSRRGGFDVFDNTKGDGKYKTPEGMAFFARDRLTAYSYSGSYDAPVYVRKEDDAGYTDDRNYQSMYECFLNIRDPYESFFDGVNWEGTAYGKFELFSDETGTVTAPDGSTYWDSWEEAEAYAEENGLEDYSIDEDPNIGTTTDYEAKYARESGHDGAIIHDVVDGSIYADPDKTDVYVVFSPEQIKSATDNAGTFDPRNPSILFQMEPIDDVQLREAISSVPHTEARRQYIRDIYERRKDSYETREFVSRDGKLKGRLEVYKQRSFKGKEHEIDDALFFAAKGITVTLLAEGEVEGESNVDALFNHETLAEFKRVKSGNAKNIAQNIKDAANKMNSEVITVFFDDRAEGVGYEDVLERLEAKRRKGDLKGSFDRLIFVKDGKASLLKQNAASPAFADTDRTNNIAQDGGPVNRESAENTTFRESPEGSTRLLFQQTEKELLDDAASFDSWQDFMEFYESFGKPEDSIVPSGADEAWYRTAWELARKRKADRETGMTAEDRDALFIREMEDGGLEDFLTETLHFYIFYVKYGYNAVPI